MTGELINHVWQSTIFAIVVGVITIAFRKNRARVRYWLWLSASLKFLLPFSLLMSLGSRFEWTPASDVMLAIPPAALTIAQATQPFLETLSVGSPAPSVRDWTAIAIFAVWACGFAGVMLTRFREWRRIRAAVRASTRIEGLGTLQVRSSPGLLEPGVVGLFRPILLLPADIAERLQPPQLKAVLAHELCHARRRDNLTSAIHMIVEALFWFHPLVWWIGARLMEERERACDEAVLSFGNEPHDYAEGILNICKSYLESRLSCVSGVTGSNLKRRIQTILTGRVARDLNVPKKLALAAMAIAALALPVTVGVINAPRMLAQSQLATLKFESASIKPCNAFRKAGAQDWSPATIFQSQCTTLQRFIQQAYGLFANGHWNPGSSLAVTGGPAWTRSDLYEINAKAMVPQSRATMNGPMLEALLKSRFQLEVHRESRQVPVYALRVAEGGTKMQPFQGSCIPRDFDKPPSDADCGTVRGYGNGFYMKAATLADLCAGFSVLLDRPVVDETGIAGRFNMRLDMSEDRESLDRPRSLPAVSDPAASPPPPVSFDAAKAAMKISA